MSIVFLIPYIPIPRMIKRINTAHSVDKTSVIFWDRGTDEIGNLNLPKEVNTHQVLEEANEGQPFKRLGATFRFCKKAFLLLYKEKPSCIHVTKTDMLLLVWLYCITKQKRKRPFIIYEVSDIHEMALNNSKVLSKVLIKKLIYFTERLGMSVVDRLIVTSESFWDIYYKNMISKDSVLFLPNTPEESVFQNFKSKENGRFRVGFIGKVRYKKQLKLLIDAAEKVDIDVLIAGNGIDLEEIKDYCRDMKNVTIHGSYKYKDEISDLYSSIDCVFSVYDTNIQNVRIALPNRLYEAAICGLPLIVSKDTELARIVEYNELGMSVDDENINEIIEAIEKLKDGLYQRQVKLNCKNYYLKYSYEITNEKLYNTYVKLDKI